VLLAVIAAELSLPGPGPVLPVVGVVVLVVGAAPVVGVLLVPPVLLVSVVLVDVPSPGQANRTRDPASRVLRGRGRAIAERAGIAAPY